jgi:ankyrin repeat protein
MLEYVLAHGGSVSAAPTQSGLTPLNLAAMGLSVPILKMVLARKPSLDESTQHVGTALMGSVRANKSNNERLPLIRELLAAGANPNVRGPRGDTALHLAVTGNGRESYVEVIRLLLDAKADPTPPNDAGETPQAMAARLGRTEASRLLAPRG